MAVDLENIGGEACEPVGGLTPQVYWAEIGDFETLNDPKDICDDDGNGAANFAELAEISESHVMKAGKKLHKVDFVTETGDLVHGLIGEVKRRLYSNTQKITIAGSEAQVLGFARYIRNKKLIWFIEEFGTGQIRQLGSKRMGADNSALEGGIEATLEGNNALIITISDKQKWIAPIYKGTLDIATDSE